MDKDNYSSQEKTDHFEDHGTHKRSWEEENSDDDNDSDPSPKRWCQDFVPDNLLIETLDVDVDFDYLPDDFDLLLDEPCEEIDEDDTVELLPEIGEIDPDLLYIPEDTDETYSDLLACLPPVQYDGDLIYPQ